jgi:phospholipid-binding lipoprotein MlaA
MRRHRVLATLLIAAALARRPAGAEEPKGALRPTSPIPAYGAAPETVNQSAQEYDPWQGFNRKIFWFNDHVDNYVLVPVATGWHTVAPQPVQNGLKNFFGNLRFPVNLVNNLLQGKPIAGAKSVGRFTVNTLLGAGGFLDPASEIGLGPQEEDFGQTLGVWGVPPGPYLVLPLLGPSDLRDAPALAVDSAAAITPFFIDAWILVGARVADVINTRAQFLKAVEDAKAASLDYYTFVRNAFLQRRDALVHDRTERLTPEETPSYENEELYMVP